jgi:hypothetical protein
MMILAHLQLAISSPLDLNTDVQFHILQYSKRRFSPPHSDKNDGPFIDLNADLRFLTTPLRMEFRFVPHVDGFGWLQARVDLYVDIITPRIR